MKTFVLLTLLVSLLTACVSVKPYRANSASVYAQPKVLLMPPDVLLVEITTAGVGIPRADWSQRATKTLVGVVSNAVAARGGKLVPYQRPEGDLALPLSRDHLDAYRMYQVVLGSILTYRYGFGVDTRGRKATLATKSKDTLEWTLGNTVAPLRRDTGADYALFLTYRHATANAGRAALSAAVFALFGAIELTSQSVGLAVLVDLHDGEVVWTSLLSGQAAEVGEPEGLGKVGQKLLKSWPL